jgi:hypothetical protein
VTSATKTVAGAKLRGLARAMHLVFAAYIEAPTAHEAVGPNVAMLRNAPDALEGAAPNLEHVTLYQAVSIRRAPGPI